MKLKNKNRSKPLTDYKLTLIGMVFFKDKKKYAAMWYFLILVMRQLYLPKKRVGCT